MISKGEKMEIGSWFEYKLKTTQTNKQEVEESVERYILSNIDENKCTFDKYVDGEFIDTVIGDDKFCIFGVKNLSMKRVENITTAFDEITVNVYGSDLCGGGEKVYIDDNNVVFRDIKTQMWSMGVIYKETRDLIDMDPKLKATFAL